MSKVRATKVNESDMFEFDMILIKENGKNLKYQMYTEIDSTAERTYYFVQYEYGSANAVGKSHFKMFYDDRWYGEGEPDETTVLVKGRDKAIAFVKAKYDELIEKGYVSTRDAAKIEGTSAAKEVLAPGESIYFERRDEYTGEKSFMYLERHAQLPFVQCQRGDIGDKGSISEFSIEHGMDNIRNLIQEHTRMRYKRKKLTPQQYDRLHKQCKLRHDFESDDDSDFFEEHVVSDDGGSGDEARPRRKKTAKKRKNAAAPTATKKQKVDTTTAAEDEEVVGNENEVNR